MSNTKNAFATDLLQLQNKIKRDPTSYRDEFLLAFHNYESTLQVFLMKPLKQNKQLADSVLFLANVSHCFPEELKNYPNQLIELLKKYSNVLHPDMRMAISRALILIRNKNLIQPIPVFELFFFLFKCNDKLLRKTLYTQLLNDVKKIKNKYKNYKLLTQVQQFVFQLIKDPNAVIAKYALTLMIDLYKKQIWNDAKTVNVISSGCFSKITKVLTVALRFFLTLNNSKDDSDKDSDDSDADDKKTPTTILLALRVGKKTKKRQKRTDRAMKTLKKEKKSKKVENYQFSALNLLYDPQDFVEKLFKEVEVTNEGFEIKIMMLDLIARLIGIHQLYLLNYYSFLIRFLTPHQREVAKMLWFAAISSHELVPPESIEQVLKTIANNFITERNTSEVIAIGINSIREICAKCPLAMSDDLLGDLTQYKDYKDKAVTTAAKSLIQLFRIKNPKLLNRRDRGKPTDEVREAKILKYGESDIKSFVPGAEIIEIKPEKSKKNSEEHKIKDDEEIEKEEEEEEDNEWGSEEEINDDDGNDEDDDDDEGWNDVEHSSDDEKVAENENENSKTQEIEEKDKIQKAIEASTQRIFTQEEFIKIQQEQLRKKIQLTSKDASAKRKTISIDDSDDENAKLNGLVPFSNITYVNKKRRHDKEARVATIMEGRKDRGKFGQRFKDQRLGKSNKEKLKTKSFMMIRHKINKKVKRSFKEKQLALRSSLLKQKKMK